MAIVKDFQTPQGFTATYHKLVRAEFNAAAEVLEITMAIYASAAARESGKPPAWHEYLRIPFADFLQDPRSLLYPLLLQWGPSYLRGGQLDGVGGELPGQFGLTEQAMQPPEIPNETP